MGWADQMFYFIQSIMRRKGKFQRNRKELDDRGKRRCDNV